MGTMALELFGTQSCPYTAELRDDLHFDGRAFVEYDVEADAAARQRLVTLCGTPLAVPVLVDDGKVVQIGMSGRSCFVAPE
ncbi:MAG: glutaredoxin [Candidatus Eremiobacteraeota bacterium]|nr:glutaredoxin [Candidatus Eremiobacteraeota bacterium]